MSDLKSRISYHSNDTGRLYVYVDNELEDVFDDVWSEEDEIRTIKTEVLENKEWLKRYEDKRRRDSIGEVR